MTQEEIDRYTNLIFVEDEDDGTNNLQSSPHADEIDVIQTNELVMHIRQEKAILQAKLDDAESDTMPVLLEYQLTSINQLHNYSSPGLNSGEIVLESGIEWFVKKMKWNKDKRKGFVLIITLEIYEESE